MNLTKKLAPRPLEQAILAMASRTGNRLTRLERVTDPNHEGIPDNEDLTGRESLIQRTTITVETERRVVVTEVRNRRSPSQFPARTGKQFEKQEEL